MNINIKRQSLLLRALWEQHGQVLPWVAFMMVLMLGMSAFVLDVGHAYFCQQQLQAATDAAALAGAQSLKTSSPTAVVTDYSAVAGNLNTYASLPGASITPGYPKYACLGTAYTQAVCVTTTDASGNTITANAIQVAEQANVPTFFAQIFKINVMSVTAVATAAIVGSRPAPTNIAVILDTTASMTTVDTNCTVNGTSAERIVCAENGVSVLLQNLSPCNIALGCGTVTNGVSQYPLDQVAIFTFPNITQGTVNQDYDCSSGTNPSIPVYSFPTVGASSYAGGYLSGSSTATYQVTPFLSDFKSTDSGTTLVTSSDDVLAVGSGMVGSTACPGMSAPGGDGTYYAGVIYAAQGALTAQSATEVAANANLIPINIIIMLTDGQANASSSKMSGTTVGGTTVNYNNPWPSGGGATSSITNYPSALDQCQQAVAAANYAKSLNTQIYAIAYGAESTGCTTDSTGPQPNITPCNVMSEIASPNTSKTTYFYSDNNQSGGNNGCTSPGSPITDISAIFGAISNDLLTVRLMPGTVWPSS